MKRIENHTGEAIHFVTRCIQLLLNVSIVAVALILCYLCLHEVYVIFQMAISRTINVHDVLQEVLAFFLYFAFVSMSVRYFKEEYHFPLRYLLYIGITATVRFLIVNRDNALQNLTLAGVVLILIVCYVLLYHFKISR